MLIFKIDTRYADHIRKNNEIVEKKLKLYISTCVGLNYPYNAQCSHLPHFKFHITCCSGYNVVITFFFPQLWTKVDMKILIYFSCFIQLLHNFFGRGADGET